MATTSALIEQHAGGLSRAIGRSVKDSSGEALSSSVEVLKVFKLHQEDVIFTWDKDTLQVFVEQDNKRSIIPLEDIEGFPSECFANRNKMAAFLSNCNLTIPKYLDQSEQKIRLSLSGLKGGGNIGLGINYWPLEEVEPGAI